MQAITNILKTPVFLCAIAIGLLSIQIQPAKAATVVAIQNWEISLNPIHTFTTSARWDDSSLTGTGLEFIFLDRFVATRFINGIGQFTAAAQFSATPDLMQSGSTVARYVDGAFDGFGNTNIPGAGVPTIPLLNVNTNTGAGGYSFRGSVFPDNTQFVYHVPISGLLPYDLVETRFSTSSTVPLPASLPLFAAGLGLCFWLRRRSPCVRLD